MDIDDKKKDMQNLYKDKCDYIDDGFEIEMPIIKESIISETEYNRFIQPYYDAMQNIYSRINILNQDYRRKTKNYAIHNTQARIKKLDSAIGKLERKGENISLENIKNKLTDIAGVRVICYFIEDVYSVVNLLKEQSDIIVIAEDDYIKNPKKNGYKSYHIVFGVPVYYIDGKQYYPVEVQIRTMSMDFWASMEHRLCYKKEDQISEKTLNKIYQYSEMLNDIERKFNKLSKKID